FATPTSPRRVAVAHSDPAVRDVLVDVERRWPLDISATPVVAQAIATGRARLLEIDHETRRRFAHDEEHLRIIEAHGGTSSIPAPLQARGKVVGLLVLSYTATSGRTYQRADVPIAEELARRIAQAIDSAYVATEALRYQERLDLLARAGEVVVMDLDAQSR